jgi:hypothetical protein
MTYPVRLTAFALACATAPGAAQPVDWRFGLEDTYAQLGGLLTEPQADALLEKMAWLTEPQAAGGDVNVNGTAGGWGGMQPTAGSPVRFAEADALVRRLQRHGFSMLWNFRINAPWASRGNADCYNRSLLTSCAPDAAHEQQLYDYVRALVERYDGDGVDDMGHETPGDPADDLRIPVRFYLMVGEIEFAGATPPPEGGYGDDARSHFWTDSAEHLLRTHRLVYRALHDADPSGNTKLVGSGGVLWDLYADFPDWPDPDGPTVRARLRGQNNHDARYVESANRLRTLLRSFGDDGDGRECDYVGWHPHLPWREIPQAFALLRRLAPGKPIYVDDMWANVFLQDRADAPGNTLFTGGGAAIEGDFPNPLLRSYADLRRGVTFGQIPGARDWYHARHSRHLVKAFATAFGEGAERVSLSGNADFALDRLGITGHINLLGTLSEGFAEKPAYHTYRLLVGMLHDFSAAEAVAVSADPRTRVYRFDRPGRGPVFVAWSETGPPPPGLDYDVATGETVTFRVGSPHVLLTRVIDEPGQTAPETETLDAPGGTLTLRLGYEPVFLEPR